MYLQQIYLLLYAGCLIGILICVGAPGWLSCLIIWLLVQFRSWSHELWDGAPGWALSSAGSLAWGFFPLAPPPTCTQRLSLPLSLSQINKWIFKRINLCFISVAVGFCFYHHNIVRHLCSLSSGTLGLHTGQEEELPGIHGATCLSRLWLL